MTDLISTTNVEFFLINIHHGKSVATVLGKRMELHTLHASVRKKDPRTFVVVTGTEATFLQEFTNRDQVIFSFSEDGIEGGRVRQLIFTCAYLVHGREAPPENVRKLVDN